MSLVFLWLLGYAMKQDWFYAGLGVQAHATALALLLFFLVVPVFTFLLHPLTACIRASTSSRPMPMPRDTRSPPI